MAVITNTTVSTDIAPAISIDLVNELHNSYRALADILGISRMDAVPEGNTIKIYKSSVKGTVPAQVAEGDEIALTETQRVSEDVTMTLKKFRKLTTAEAIQKSGRENAIYDTDRALIREVRKGVKADFNTFLGTGTGTATAGSDFQSQLANNWDALQTYFEDADVEPVHFVSSKDVAEYLGSAQISMQTAFGMTYVEDFLGLGTVFIIPSLAKGTVYSTAKENLHCAYVPANGAVGQEFGLTADETGIVGVTHERNIARASIETLVLTGAKFYAEELAGVVKGVIA